MRSLPGWRTFGEDHGLIATDGDGTPSGYAVQLETFSGERVGVEQEFVAWGAYQVHVDVDGFLGATAPILIELVRPDGSSAASATTVVNAAGFPSAASLQWCPFGEEVVTEANVVVQLDDVVVSYDT